VSSADYYLTKPVDARRCVRQTVYWDDLSASFVFLRKGLLEAVVGQHVVINGDYRELGSLPGLRNFENGGEWHNCDPANKGTRAPSP
jgi:hypothetical protein